MKVLAEGRVQVVSDESRRVGWNCVDSNEVRVKQLRGELKWFVNLYDPSMAAAMLIPAVMQGSQECGSPPTTVTPPGSEVVFTFRTGFRVVCSLVDRAVSESTEHVRIQLELRAD